VVFDGRLKLPEVIRDLPEAADDGEFCALVAEVARQFERFDKVRMRVRVPARQIERLSQVGRGIALCGPILALAAKAQRALQSRDCALVIAALKVDSSKIARPHRFALELPQLVRNLNRGIECPYCFPGAPQLFQAIGDIAEADAFVRAIVPGARGRERARVVVHAALEVRELPEDPAQDKRSCYPGACSIRSNSPAVDMLLPKRPTRGGKGVALGQLDAPKLGQLSHQSVGVVQDPPAVFELAKRILAGLVGQVASLFHVALVIDVVDLAAASLDGLNLRRKIEQVGTAVAEYEDAAMRLPGEYSINRFTTTPCKSAARDLMHRDRHLRLVVDASVDLDDANRVFIRMQAGEVLVAMQDLEIQIPLQSQTFKRLLDQRVKVRGAQEADVSSLRQFGQKQMSPAWRTELKDGKQLRNVRTVAEDLDECLERQRRVENDLGVFV
jgi:hypothetical protein